ncbi:transposase [bacterium]|nr:transposase [bacterium]
MSRKPRIDLPNYYYHVYSRGQRGNPIFFTDHDMDVFEDIVYRALKKFDFDITMYSLMRTHYHFQIFRNKIELSQIFHWINTIYAMYFNKSYGLIGHVFQGRFNSRIVLNEKYNYILFEYILQNAHKAGYVKDGQIYKHSGEGYYIKNKPNKLITRPIAKNYEEIKFDERILESPFYIGLEEDITNNTDLINIFNKHFGKINEINSIDNIIKTLLEYYGISKNMLISSNKNRSLVKYRNAIIKCLYYKYGFSTVLIGEKIKMSFQQVAKIVNKKGEKGEVCP